MKNKRMEISFWRRKSRQEGKIQIYCRISVGGEREDIGSTGLTAWYDHWDDQQKRFTHHDPEAFFKNERIGLIREQLLAVFNDLFRKREKITAAKIRRLYFGQGGSVLLLAAFKMYLDDSAIDPERKLKSDSVKTYEHAYKKLTKFLTSEKATDLLIEDFDLTWMHKFRRWMKRVPLKAGKIGHEDSYIIRNSHTIIKVLVWAKLHKISDSNPLEGMRLKGPKFGKPVFISVDQFEQLRQYHFSQPELQKAADLFIILCRSGFHYGDLKDLIIHHHDALRMGVNGDLWVIKNRIKTQVVTRVPIFDEVQAIVDKYGGWDKLPVPCLNDFNDSLKLIAAKLGLPERLSSKAGRKTFTDWCFNTLLLSTDAIMVLLGRKTDIGLEVYGKPDERRVAGELAQSKEMQKRKKKKNEPGATKK